MNKDIMTKAMNYIDDDMIENAAQSGKTKKAGHRVSFVKIGSLAACVCLVIAAVVMWRYADTGSVSPSINVSSEQINGKQEYPPDKIKINKSSGVGQADYDVEILHINDKLPYAVWQDELKKFRETVGIDYDSFVAKAGDYTLNEFYGLLTRAVEEGELAEEYTLHDYAFSFSGKNADERIELAVSTVEPPLRDCFIICDNPKESMVNGCKMYIQQMVNTYITQFSYNGLYYDIESYSISLDEFLSFVKAYIG